jgi:LmbE family N-acetylglucosaminyl deacetylase
MSAQLETGPTVATERILSPEGHPLFIFAHQDDETVLAGMIRRIAGDGQRGRFVWWTNGDGLAPEAGAHPATYAKMRIEEADRALERLGASRDRKIDLESSEIENYRRMTHVAEGGRVRERAMAYFLEEAKRVEHAVREADPDRVFLLAWQGGHPEHDLVHLMTVRAVRKLRAETGRAIPIIQSPAYEYTIACALRFKPWFRGDKRCIVLDEHEVELKRGVFEAYTSQQQLFGKFERWIKALQMVNRVRGRAATVEDYLRIEQFGVVDPRLDYTHSTHHFDRLNYMFDDFEGTPIRFSTMLRPIAAALLYDRDS